MTASEHTELLPAGIACRCQNCGRTFIGDLLVPDDIWAKISPAAVGGDKGGGLLCGACIVDRIVEFGLATVVSASVDHIPGISKMVPDGAEPVPVAWRYRPHGQETWAVLREGEERYPSDFEYQPLFASPTGMGVTEGWQTIDTAPRDGSWLDLWAGDRRIPDVRWVDEADPDEQGFTYGWVGPTGHYVLGEDEEATHWMRVERPAGANHG